MGMKPILEPLENGSEIYIHGKGQYEIQLEVPEYTSLTQSDVERILGVVSWEDDINEQIDGYEGGRSVIIKKGKTSYSCGVALNGLQISGIGYNPVKQIKETKLYEEGDRINPPTIKNFYDLPEIPQMSTTGIKDNSWFPEIEPYAPIGSYTEGRWRSKIKNTQEIDSLNFKSFSVPSVEAYGRYLNMRHDDENLGFIIFSIPDIRLRRFAAQFVNDFKGNSRDFLLYMIKVAHTLGRSARELHEGGYVHRQLHFSNFYYLENQKPHIMDWSTMVTLNGSDDEAVKRAIDVRIPHQNCEMVYNALFGEGYIGLVSIAFLDEYLKSYFKDDA